MWNMKQSRVIKAGGVIQVKVTRLPGYFFNDLFSLAGKHMRITPQLEGDKFFVRQNG